MSDRDLDKVDRDPDRPEQTQVVRGPFGFVATVVGSGAFIGLIVITATVLMVDSLRTGNATDNLNRSFYLLVGGTLTGLLAAAFAAWHLLAPVDSVYRRGALSIVCSFATVLLMLICIPIHQLLGRNGLLLLLALSGPAALILVHRAKRLGGME